MTESTRPDVLETLLGELAQRAVREGEPARGPHLEAATLLAHLERALDAPRRAEVVAHLAGCSECCDRLTLARDLMRLDRVGDSALARSPVPEPLELGPALMRVTVSLSPQALRVVESDAQLRIGSAVALRGGAGATGVGFRRALEAGELGVELLERGRGAVTVSVTLDGAPEAARVSRIEAGRLVETRPLVHGLAVLRVPLRTSWLRLEAPGRILGHVRLELEAESCP